MPAECLYGRYYSLCWDRGFLTAVSLGFCLQVTQQQDGGRTLQVGMFFLLSVVKIERSAAFPLILEDWGFLVRGDEN